MATIRDVAKVSGYSTATVSRALNNSGYISAKARQKIIQAMTDLDYAPNVLAQNLSAGTAHTIGVVLPNIHQDYFTSLINGIMTTALDAEQQLVLLPSIYNADTEREYLKQLKQHAFDGLIFISPTLPLQELATYHKYGKIVICQPADNYPINAIYIDRMQAYESVFQWLKQQGTDRIACLQSRGQNDSFTSWATDTAYEHVFEHPLVPDLIYSNVWSYNDSYQIAKIIAQTTPNIKFILANGDDMVFGLRKYYLDQQLKMPTIVGQGTSVLDQALGIPRIDHHVEQVGKIAFELATSRQHIPQELVVQSTFIK